MEASIENLLKFIPRENLLQKEQQSHNSRSEPNLDNFHEPLFKNTMKLFMFHYCSKLMESYVSSNISFNVPIQLEIIKRLSIRLIQCDKTENNLLLNQYNHSLSKTVVGIKRQQVENFITTIDTFQSTDPKSDTEKAMDWLFQDHSYITSQIVIRTLTILEASIYSSYYPCAFFQKIVEHTNYDETMKTINWNDNQKWFITNYLLKTYLYDKTQSMLSHCCQNNKENIIDNINRTLYFCSLCSIQNDLLEKLKATVSLHCRV